MTPLAYLALVLALGISAQWLAWRLKLPSILILLAFGFGLSLTTGASIDDYLVGETGTETLLAVVGFFVAIILFEGGLTLKFSELREAGAPVVRLCTLGVAISFALISVATGLIFGWDWRVAALLGAILVVTGPTVVGPLLRVIKPVRKITSIVKWEGIVIDPIGAILAVLVFQVAIAGGVQSASGAIFLALGKTILVGIVIAVALAKLIEFLLKRHLIPDFLESVSLLAVVAVAFAASNAIQAESGLLTATVLGITLANQKSVSVREILEFKENLRVLIISVLFIVLSGRISPSELHAVALPSLGLLVVLILLVRPASVFLANLGSKSVNYRERTFLAALAPRGIVAAAVTSVFAIELNHAADHGELPAFIATQADQLVPVVVIIIIGTVLVYGVIATPLAQSLGLAVKDASGVLFAGADNWTRKIAKALLEDGHSVMLLDTRYENVAAARMEGLHAIRANILSEYAEENLEFPGISQLVAGTSNDEVNSLATREFAHIFGKANVWQITPNDKEKHHSTTVASHRRGRICFSEEPTFLNLQNLARQNAVVKKTLLTEIFTLEHFHTNYGEDAVILFLHDEDKGLRPAAADLDSVPTGTTIYALVRPD
ncbi:MAG: cation:proton antiporter [Roseibacillus sp.]|nr:cation:proton antiporter [Roseibacillus sp.]